MSGNHYLAWMATEDALVEGALFGLAIATSFAFFILLVSTRNIHISVFSAISIGGILTCVLSMMQLNSMELGLAESISVVILIGFSVD